MFPCARVYPLCLPPDHRHGRPELQPPLAAHQRQTPAADTARLRMSVRVPPEDVHTSGPLHRNQEVRGNAPFSILPAGGGAKGKKFKT